MNNTEDPKSAILALCKARGGSENLTLPDLLMVAKALDSIDPEDTVLCEEDALLALWAANGIWEGALEELNLAMESQ